jgi:hypothetical protein
VINSRRAKSSNVTQQKVDKQQKSDTAVRDTAGKVIQQYVTQQKGDAAEG